MLVEPRVLELRVFSESADLMIMCCIIILWMPCALMFYLK